MKELAKKLGKLRKNFAGNTVRSATHAAAGAVRKKMRARAPKEDRALEHAIIAVRRKQREGEAISDVGVTGRGPSGVRYGHIQEFGSSQQTGTPFARPGLEDAIRDNSIINAYITRINKAIAKESSMVI